MTEIKQKIDIKKFSDIIRELIKFKSGVTKLPIVAGSWEELIWATLVFLFGDEKVEWDPQSHEKSVDIKVNINGDILKISAKGGKVKNGVITISSYRLTTFNTLNEKLKFIKKQHDNFNFYLICLREIDKKNITYYVIKTSPKRLSPKWLVNQNNWIETKNSYDLKDGFKFDAKIVLKMSKQLWYSIPFKYFSKKEILVKLSIPCSDLGRNLVSFLKNKFG